MAVLRECTYVCSTYIYIYDKLSYIHIRLHSGSISSIILFDTGVSMYINVYIYVCVPVPYMVIWLWLILPLS